MSMSKRKVWGRGHDHLPHDIPKDYHSMFQKKKRYPAGTTISSCMGLLHSYINGTKWMAIIATIISHRASFRPSLHNLWPTTPHATHQSCFKAHQELDTWIVCAACIRMAKPSTAKHLASHTIWLVCHFQAQAGEGPLQNAILYHC